MEIRFKKLVEADLPMVLGWRTRDDISKWMFTDVKKSLKKQRQWFDSIKNDLTKPFWIVRVDNKPVGCLFLKDCEYGSAEIGYYFADNDLKGLMSLVPPAFYWWAFNNGFNRFILHIFTHHTRLIPLHFLHGFRIVKVLKKHARGRDVYRMALDKHQYRGAKVLPIEVEM